MEDLERVEEFLEGDISIPENVEVTEPLKIYLNEIRQIPVLGPEEERQLGKQIAAGDLDAKRKLEESALRLVVSVARHFAGCGMQFMDLIQEGNIGLMYAVEKFDYTKGSSFSEHAIPYIKEAIRNAADEQAREIRVPAHVAESMQKVQEAAHKLKKELGWEATAREIAELIGGKTAEEVENILTLLCSPAVLETPGREKGDSDFEDSAENDVNAPEDAVNSLIRQEEVARLLDHLSEKEQKIIRLRFGLEGGKAYTAEEVGEAMNVAKEQIQQIEEHAMGKLREAAENNE